MSAMSGEGMSARVRVVEENVMRVLSVFVLGLVPLTLAGCAADYAKQTPGDVIMEIVSFTPGDPFQSDVLNTKSGTVADEFTANVAVRFKNSALPTPSIPNAVILDRYTVDYIRSDGHNIQGVDVPYSISGDVHGIVDVATNGSTGIPLELVRLSAKFEPPLSNLAGLGGAIVLTCFAEVNLYGHTVSGVNVSAAASLEINFADYKDQ